jgi:hypothetical protein
MGSARDALLGSGVATQSSCGDLGDLPPGAVLTWKGLFDPPADGCGDTVDVYAVSLTTATVSDPNLSYATMTLPDGCTGRVYFQIETLGPDGSTSYLDNSLSNGEPHWWLVRSFAPELEGGTCMSGKSVACADAFIAKTTAIP